MDVEEQNLSSDSQSSITRQHSRRPLAHKSVSLLHSPRASQHQACRHRQKPVVDFTAGSDSILSQPIYPEKNSSGESSNAEKWFEKSNNNVKTRAAVLDDSKTSSHRNIFIHS
jgi:hypothetical protein